MVNHVRFLVRWESESWESGIVSDLTDRKDTYEEFRIVFTRVGKKLDISRLSSLTPSLTPSPVKPRVVIASANDLSRRPRILEKAKENCFVSNSIKAAIKIEPEVFHQQTPATPCPLDDTPALSDDSSEQEDKDG